MKIVLVIPTLKQGGAERVMSELANKFEKRGNEVTMALWIGGEQFYHLNRNIKIIDFKSAHDSKIDKIKGLVNTVFSLRRTFKEKQPDAVISFLTKSNIISLLSASFLDTKIYISERGSPERWDKAHPWITIKLRDLTYGKAAGFIAQTKDAKKAAESKFGIKKCRVIPNPIKSQKIVQTEKEKIILNVGRLHEGKGQDLLIDMFAKLDAPDWRLIILGEGPYRETLEKMIQALGLKDRVEVPGAMKNIDYWLSRASIFAFPSLHEGFPNALAEAMAAGVPSVSFDCTTGPADLIEDGENGFLVPLNDIDLFTKRLQQLINDEKLKDKFSNEAKKVNEIYSLDMISNKLLRFIDSEENEDGK